MYKSNIHHHTYPGIGEFFSRKIIQKRGNTLYCSLQNLILLKSSLLKILNNIVHWAETAPQLFLRFAVLNEATRLNSKIGSNDILINLVLA